MTPADGDRAPAPEYVSVGCIWRVETRGQMAQRFRASCPQCARDIPCLEDACACSSDEVVGDRRHRAVQWGRFDAEAELDFDQAVVGLVLRDLDGEQRSRLWQRWQAYRDREGQYPAWAGDPDGAAVLVAALDQLDRGQT